MERRRHIRKYVALAAMLFCLCARSIAQETSTSLQPQTGGETPIVLDRVIAIVNGDVLLESDVRAEMRVAVLQPITVPAGQNTEVNAAQRLIRRALILQQMRSQQGINYSVSDEEVKKSLAELRAQIPICRQIGCSTEQGWQAFLRTTTLPSRRLSSGGNGRNLKFINVRFGAGITSRGGSGITRTVVPTFEDEGEAPTLEA